MENIKIPTPAWSSEIVKNILSLEKLRSDKIISDIPPYIFFQLKTIFQTLETIGSSRIEGNHTTLSEYVDKLIGKNHDTKYFIALCDEYLKKTRLCR